ncbi:MAG: substrate-binding domain-containing protein [Phycisphaerae bacterium]|nr:substrate-binding domain-containing protein [Phycisphaerae bacterium]
MLTTSGDRTAALRRYVQRRLVGLREGEALPSVRSIMRVCGASQAKVDQILGEFSAAGLIERVPRRGLFKSGKAGTTLPSPVIDLIYCGVPEGRALREVSFHSELVDRLARRATQRGQAIRVHEFHIGSSYEGLGELSGRPEMMCCIIVGENHPEIVRAAETHHVAWVSLFPERSLTGRQTILIDAEAVVRLQLEHLWSLGHERIAYLHVVDERVMHRDHVLRREAFYKLMAERGLTVRDGWVAYGDYFETPFKRAFAAVLDGEDQPTAAIVSDPHLPWAYAVLRERGLAAGRDFSLVGTDDLALAGHIDPPATTVRVCRTKAVEMAMEMLDEVAAGTAIDEPRYLPVELVIRGSTGELLIADC